MNYEKLYEQETGRRCDESPVYNGTMEYSYEYTKWLINKIEFWKNNYNKYRYRKYPNKYKGQ